jgi:energy-coupling factor transporter transmembrane protein EcfT
VTALGLAPGGVLVRGLGGVLVTVSTAALLGPSDLREALTRLPVPAAVAAILLQIVQQTAVLGAEASAIAAAMTVRGAGAGLAASARILAALPRAWLPRVLARAERVAAAMAVRGLDGVPAALRPAPLGRSDALVLAAALLPLAGVAAARLAAP